MVTVFLLATILGSRNSPLWKSSALALLYSRDTDKEVRSVSDRENMAKKTYSHLERAGERHRLIHLDERSQKPILPNESQID